MRLRKGYIRHKGGAMPVSEDTIVSVVFRPYAIEGVKPFYHVGKFPAHHLWWDHNGDAGDIIGYKIEGSE